MSRSGWENAEKFTVTLQGDCYTFLSKMIHVYFEAVRGIYYHRAINEYINRQDDEWYEGHILYLSGLCLDMGVLAWSKLFGSQRSQDTHFMHFLKYDDLKDCLLQLGIANDEDLRVNLFNYLNLTEAEFDDYKNESIIKYRDKFIAHTDLKLYVLPEDDDATAEDKKERQLRYYPHFDIADRALYWLYDLISKLLRCKKSETGWGYGFAVYAPSVIESQIQEECSQLFVALKKVN